MTQITQISGAIKYKILYFEFRDCDVHRFGSKYCYYKTYLRSARTGNYRGPAVPSSCAEKIWCWDPINNEVKFVKNRRTGKMTKVDSKEFLMIQLQSSELKN